MESVNRFHRLQRLSCVWLADSTKRRCCVLWRCATPWVLKMISPSYRRERPAWMWSPRFWCWWSGLDFFSPRLGGFFVGVKFNSYISLCSSDSRSYLWFGLNFTHFRCLWTGKGQEFFEELSIVVQILIIGTRDDQGLFFFNSCTLIFWSGGPCGRMLARPCCSDRDGLRGASSKGKTWLITLPETNSSPLKMEKMNFSVWDTTFSEANC